MAVSEQEEEKEEKKKKESPNTLKVTTRMILWAKTKQCVHFLHTGLHAGNSLL